MSNTPLRRVRTVCLASLPFTHGGRRRSSLHNQQSASQLSMAESADLMGECRGWRKARKKLLDSEDAAAMDRGSRLINLFQQLEKLQGPRQGHKYSPEDLHQLRYTTSKILQYISASAPPAIRRKPNTGSETIVGKEQILHLVTYLLELNKVHRDLVLKNSDYLGIIFTTLETCSDTCTETNIVYIINELIGKSHTGKRASILVAHGVTHVLLQTLVCAGREENIPDDFLILIHQVLAKLGPKDRKFGVKARLSQALPVTSSLIRNHISNPKLLQPLLQVLKLYATNAVNASYLGKNGAITFLFKILSVCGKKHLTLLKYALDTLSLLVKSKSNSARAIGQGGVPILLNMFLDWHRGDSKNRHIALRKAILHVLKHITNLKSGRKALMEADGIRGLYSACLESIECRELESVIVLASLIMRKCFPRNRLPVSSLRGPLSCELPVSDFHTPETGEGQDLPLPIDLEPSPAGDDNEYESSIDNDDDISSDDDPEAAKMDSEHEATVVEEGNRDEKEDDADTDSSGGASYQRSWEDLQSSYAGFFPELTDFDAILDDDCLPLPEPNGTSIVIPTASFEMKSLRESASAMNTASAQKSRRKVNNHFSLPNLAGPELTEALHNLKLNSVGSDSESSDATSGSGRQTSSQSHKVYSKHKSPTGQTSVTAVNLKTGSSVFSLDMSPKVSPKPPTPKARRKSGRRLSSGRMSANGRDREPTSKSSKEDWGNEAANNSPESPELDQSDSEENFASVDLEEEYCNTFESPEIYAELATQTRSVGCFSKIAYPDMYGHIPPPYKEPIYEKPFGVQRAKIFEDIDRFINPEQIIDRVVYDMDEIVAEAGNCYSTYHSNLTNRDEIKVATREDTADHLYFNSQFECGNLRKAIQVREYEYDLILNPDVNTNHHHQWFYFEMSNMEAGVKYRFNIVNCEKLNSQFNFGMRPVMFSVMEAMCGRPYWIRVGQEICYYKNHFLRSSQTTGGVRGKSYFTCTFCITFKHHKDICYLAYHYPYTYTMLRAHIYKWENTYDSSFIYYKHHTLTRTIGGNPVPCLTITSHPTTYDREGIEAFKNRPYIFLSSRVHPGESNSSWVMRGTINYLMSNRPAAQNLRDNYIFKIVPMLNPDGVINGNHRCSLVAEDLNRRWLHPCPKLHPSIYHTKGLLQYLAACGKSPLVYCDYHGHSRRKNVFLYGCSPSLSWMTEDLDNPAVSGNKVEDTGYKTLPRILQNIAPAFSLSNCSFMVEKSKESTARVVVWRQMKVVRSYTMESSYCGCDQGSYRGLHISTRELEEMGRKFCEGLTKVRSRHCLRRESSASLSGLAAASSSTELGNSTGRLRENSSGGRADLESDSSDSESNLSEADDSRE